MSEYNMPPIGLFGRRCKIKTGFDEQPFVYRIVSSGTVSNAWCEIPLVAQSKPTTHDCSTHILIVVLDTLISDDSRLIRVAANDVELMNDVDDTTVKGGRWEKLTGMAPPEYHGHHICSVCEAFAPYDPLHQGREELSPFCPSCGAKMGRRNQNETHRCYG